MSIKKETAGTGDPFIWLEEVESPKALAFANSESKKTIEHFKKDPIFAKIEAENRSILLAKDRVPEVSIRNGELYNFWRDEIHVRGLWRKTSIASYKSGHPQWEILLDLDNLAKSENENWVWKSASVLPETFDRAIIGLSRGGKDAKVYREFDLKTKSFVVNGFYLPESKGSLTWIDRDSVFVSTDFGPETMTSSGYPRIVKKWTRGRPLSEAVEVNRVNPIDIYAHSNVIRRPEGNYIIHSRRIGFYEGETWLEMSQGAKVKIPMPLDSEFQGIFKEQLLFVLRSDLGEFKKGSLVSLPISKITEGESALLALHLVFAPTDKRFVEFVAFTKNYLLISIVDDVLSKIIKVDLGGINEWTAQDVHLGDKGMVSLVSADESSDLYIASYVNFLTPASTYLGDAQDIKNKMTVLVKAPERFSAEGLQVERYFAVSADGTRIPYFLVGRKNLKLDGSNPTLLYGYGGFENSMQPFYLGVLGKVWLERGGVYVLSNLRGGGEYGPAWHQAVLKENRYKVFEDNIAIAEDLIRRKITSPMHLGIKGGSNGGLLVGGTVVMRPDLFNAVLCQVPLLDMLRYHKLLAGASWMDEYGNPDDLNMRQAILKYSPYQNVKPGVKYPEIFFMTSTKDDRVHPGHARKMVAKMKEQGHSVFYYENTEGGHGGSANIEQSILWLSLEATYLWEKLGPAAKTN